MAITSKQPKIGYFIQSRGPGDRVEFEEVYIYGPTQRSDEGVVGHDLRMRPMRLGPGNYTFVGSPDDVEWTRPVSEPTKSHAQIKSEIDEVLARPYSHATKKSSSSAELTSEAIIAKMIGRRVRPDWNRHIDGKIIQWEPFGTSRRDALVKDIANGSLSWWSSFSLSPIDGKGPLPSRREVRKIREAETGTSLRKIGEPPPRIPR